MLLDSVRDDPSDKFAKSEFMGFMRKLRDREVVVDGEQFVERADFVRIYEVASPVGPLTCLLSTDF